MSTCDSQNIVKFYDGYFYMDRYWMFLEFMDSGCLTNIIEKNMWEKFDEKAI